MKISLVTKNKKIIKIKVIIVFSIFVVLLLMLPFHSPEQEKPFSLFYIIFSIFGIIWIIANIYSNFWLMPYKVVGHVEFKGNGIVLPEGSIEGNQISLLKIVFINYGGQATAYNSFSVTHGSKNIITIETYAGDRYEYNLLLSNKNEYLRIQKIIKIYAKKGINVEFYKHKKLVFKS